MRLHPGLAAHRSVGVNVLNRDGTVEIVVM